MADISERKDPFIPGASREKRIKVANQIHRLILERVAEHCEVPEDDFMEGFLSSEHNETLMNSFVAKGGLIAVIFSYEKISFFRQSKRRETFHDGNRMKRGLGAREEDTTVVHRVKVNDGFGGPIQGRNVLVFRLNNNAEITYNNMTQELYYNSFDVDRHGTLVGALQKMFELILVQPTLTLNRWGKLLSKPTGAQVRDQFLGLLSAHNEYLSTTNVNLLEMADMHLDTDIGVLARVENHPHPCSIPSKEPDLALELDQLMRTWYRKIEQVIESSHSLRRETADLGPRAELEYWRYWMTKFTTLRNFIHSKQVRLVTSIMLAPQPHPSGDEPYRKKPLHIEKWQDLRQRLKSVWLESMENVKYLDQMSDLWEKLYSTQLPDLPEHLRSLFYSIGMMYSSSRFFNTTERANALPIKVTNQLIISIRNYLTENGTISLWSSPKSRIIFKIKECLKVRDQCIEIFDATKQSLAKKDYVWKCSEVTVFVRLQHFCERLLQIQEVLQKYVEFSVLNDCGIEGADPLSRRLNNALKDVFAHPGDPLNDRDDSFDVACNAYKQEIATIEKGVRELLKKSLTLCPDVELTLEMLERFEKLNFSCLDLTSSYLEQFQAFQKEMDKIRDSYNRERGRNNVPVAMPPFSGRIAWIRMLFKKIERPMKKFQKIPYVMEQPCARRVIQQYNSLYRIFMQYELEHHKTWCDAVIYAESLLSAPVLRQEGDMIVVNWDFALIKTAEEAEFMWKMGLDVPEAAALLQADHERILGIYDGLFRLVSDHNVFRRSIPSIYMPLMGSSLYRLDITIERGFQEVTWMSLSLADFYQSFARHLNKLKCFLAEIKDIYVFRIQEPMKYLSSVELLVLPVDKPLGIDELLRSNEIYRNQLMEKLNSLIMAAEIATKAIVNAFMDTFDVPSIEREKKEWLHRDNINAHTDADIDTLVSDKLAFRRWNRPNAADLPRLHRDGMRVYSLMFRHFIDSLHDSVIKSLERLLSRLDDEKKAPFIKAEIKVVVPTVLLEPSFRDIEKNVASLAQDILSILPNFFLWGSSDTETEQTDSRRGTVVAIEEPKEDLNYYELITSDREIFLTLERIYGSFSHLSEDVHRCIEIFERFSHMWHQNVEEEVDDFLSSDPALDAIEKKVDTYMGYWRDVQSLKDFYDVCCFRLGAVDAKLVLGAEAKKWTAIFGRRLVDLYSNKINNIQNFIEDKNKILQKEITDLDSLRLEMACLQVIEQSRAQNEQEIEKIDLTCNFMSGVMEVQMPEEVLSVEALRYNYQKLLEKAKKVQQTLLELHEPFKKRLLNELEILKEDVEMYHENFEKDGPKVLGISAQDASDRVTVMMMRLDTLMNRWEIIADGERLFDLPVTDFPSLKERQKELQILNRLYALYEQVMRVHAKYLGIPWTELDIETMANDFSDLQTRYRKLPKTLLEYPAYAELVQKVDDMRELCPLLELVAHPSLQERHWDRLTQLTNFTFPYQKPSFSLKHVLQAPLLIYKEGVEDICISAQKEQDVALKLKNVVNEWQATYLSFSQFKKRGELLLKGQETREIITQLEDNLMALSSLSTNRYNEPYRKDIKLWLKKLGKTSETLETWLQVQNLWLYLEAVFVAGDIARQLPQETKRFSTIDKAWVRLMITAHDKLVVEVASHETNYQLLDSLLEQLELCQKSLTGYLETLRRAFPRFCFVSDPTLLEILGEASDCQTIQKHLLNVFENVYEVKFNEEEKDRVDSMYSREREHVHFVEPVKCIGPVEKWLLLLMDATHLAVNNVIGLAAGELNEPNFNIIDLLDKYPAQVGLLAVQMLWTRDAEIALLKSRSEHRAMREANASFLKLLNLLIQQTTRELSKTERVKFETLVTVHVHQRDIFDELTRRRIRSPKDFEWLKNMRFYWLPEEEDTLVSITDVNFIYQNEFMGCTERLVITPLTDRCYITLAQAIGMSMGGAPAGPAGTGKTETTKDMAKALGKYCVVFNCSDQMDFRGLGRIFKGLAQSGSWGCFDEFNRIQLPVLSVAAQQISIVLTARKERKSSFVFSDGDVIPLSNEFGIFITMNPGYAGRQELPENLKMMFRPIAMMVPDRQIIMRVKLAACGFIENVDLARKFFTLYRLCEEQLSKQVHYDFGLRNILSVLRTLGAQKRMNPKDSEETTVMRVLRYMNVSKLVDEDEPLFTALLNDLFPNQKIRGGKSNLELQKEISQACIDNALINHPPWNLKIIQLYETSLVRHGLMVLGPTGAGKTTCLRTLMDALTKGGTPHREVRMNPKAITASQMFGLLDVATNDWTDGIFSTLWRRTLRVPPDESTWLILDGPVDAVWIENLNSVLDDNKTLTLANGDRITMAPNCKLVFEPDSITNASPATVSRMGMVFISGSVMPWPILLKGWLLKRPAHETQIFEPLFEKIYSDLEVQLTTKWTRVMYLPKTGSILQCCSLLEGLLRKFSNTQNLSPKHFERFFLFALMWSVGALLELPARDEFEVFVRRHLSRLDWPPRQGFSIFEYMVDEAGEWQHWSSRVEEYEYPDDSVPDYLSILIPNIDNVRTVYLIETIAELGKPVLLTGESGTAKTVMTKSYLSELDPEHHLFRIYNFSSATTPHMLQKVIESYVEKRIGNKFGPAAGRKMSVFIDDLSMPIVNEWGDQVTNELVRQLIEAGGFYSLDKPGEFSIIEDLNIIAAMIHPGGGRNDIPQRLKRQFAIFNCTLPSNASIEKIFSVIAEGYFCSSRFPKNIVNMVPRLVPLTREVWQIAKNTMLPTPTKFHYVFNLRDLSRIWQGMLTVTREGCTRVEHLLELWRHECQRVISDRFVTEEEQDSFRKVLTDTASSLLGDEALALSQENRFFVDFLREAPEPMGDEPEGFSFDPPKIYEIVPSWEVLEKKLLEYQTNFNETVRGSKLNIVFFRDAMRHLLTISRAIRISRGSIVLVGVGGSGKQSLTKLASFIAGYRTFQITLTRAYNLGNFLEDLRVLYRIAGQQGQGVTFLFTENDIKDETFLEYLNNALSAGEIPNLFPREDLEEICNSLIPIMKKEDPRREPTMDALYSYFLTRAQSNLHIVLCFSPVGPKFRSRVLKFPGLISGCVIDWLQKWPPDALIAVSRHLLMPFSVVCSAEVKEDLIEVMAGAHIIASDACVSYYERFRRLTHVTPKSFLSLIDSYKHLYTAQLENIRTLNERMAAGLNRLVEAAEAIDVLKKELLVMEEEIAVTSADAEKVMIEVKEKREQTEAVKSSLQVVKERAQALVAEIARETNVTEFKLSAAKPMLEKAEAALQTIKASDIANVRKLGNPPFLITAIMDVVLILFRRKILPVTPDVERNFMQISWSESLKMMADPRFLQKIMTYPKDGINAETIELMLPYLTLADYNYEKAKASSGDVAGLLMWTRAMADFYYINKDVLPLKANLAIQKRSLKIAEGELAEAQVQLDQKQNELNYVQKLFEEADGKQQACLKQALACKTKMDRASALIDGLTDERERWSEQLTQFNAQTERLVGDALLLTAFLCYSGPFNQEYRFALQKDWRDQLEKRKIPTSANLSLIDTLTTQAIIGEWNLHGLPSDELSVQNGILVTKAPRYPLLIDPQTQGKNWLKNLEKEKGLKVTTLNDRYFRNCLEDCLSLGYPMIIEDVLEELDPVLDNVLEKNHVKLGTSLKVKVGDKEVDIDPNFRLYITTKLPNPAFAPEITARTAVIDFTVTMKGLEEQLLGRVIVSEKRELEEQRLSLIEGVTKCRRDMEELETNLLQKLSSIKGSLVEDEGLMIMLNESKDTSAGLKVKLEEGRRTEEELNTAREVFRPVATRGSILYFLITDMAEVNCMYQTSLAQFLERFDLSLDRSEKESSSSKRIKNINDFLTYEVFRYKTRGLYVANKFMFALLLALKVDLEKGTIHNDEFQFLIKGGGALDLLTVTPKPKAWISDISWLNLVGLSNVRGFHSVIEDVANDEAKWKSWFNKEAPENATPPAPYNQLECFKRLLLIRAWCPDRMLSAGRQYIKHSLGDQFAEPVILHMESMIDESRANTPMLCLLSPGADPTPQIVRIAKAKRTHCSAVSMGQGQEIHARKLLESAMSEGGWVLLQNCHLGLDYMSEVAEKIIGAETINSDFRLFLTTEVHCLFPISLLHISIKFTNEAPQGIRAGLCRTYADMTEDTLDTSDLPEYLPLLFTTSFFHTVVQERRKFGPMGWNIPYDFNTSDWLASVTFISYHLDVLDSGKISWQTIRYMIGEIQYGGRVTDDYDKRLLIVLTRHWFNDAMMTAEHEFHPGYPVLRFKTVAEYFDALGLFPDSDSPRVVGLHPNANINFQAKMMGDVLSNILQIQPKQGSSTDGGSREERVSEAVKDMLNKLPPIYDPHETQRRVNEMGHLSPMVIFLRQEIDCMTRVLTLVRKTLKDLLAAIAGSIVMNEDLSEMMDRIDEARIPVSWLRGSWDSTTLGFWFTELLERNRQFSTWLSKGRPLHFWLGGFFNPQGFITAMRQEVTRAHKGWSLDSVVLSNNVLRQSKEEMTRPPLEGVLVYGLFLEGAGWDRRNGRLAESLPKVLSVPMPLIHINAINADQVKKESIASMYLCPVYKKHMRTDQTYITALYLTTNKPPDHWTMRGVALLCDTKF